MNKNNSIYAALFISLFLILFPNQTLAKESSNLGYTVSAVLNGKQIDPEKSYFYIQTVPEEEQTLKVKVKSTQKEPIKLKIFATNAFTGDSGTIEYTGDKYLLDETLKVPINAILKVETPSLTVGNFEEKEAIFKLIPPKENYSGIKMGALFFEIDDSENKSQMSNKFAYRIGLITSETGDDYKDSKTLNLVDVKSSIKRGKKMVLTTLQNPEPKILNNLEVKAEVKEKEKQTVLKKKTVGNYMLAPNSHFDFEIDWGTAAVKAGTYIVTIKASNGYSDWTFEKEFTISGTQAKEMNDESSFKIVTPTWIKIAAVLGFLLMGIMSSLIFIRRKKMETEWNRRRKKKKKRKKKVGK
ncbi:DUF916 and DUF3324 domain-containing protein [Enterococcus rivorum]|uniref:Uncharacterized protein n=1 Tax=Enterococcus rivorum TaxID=762845 RepID=A0A1E5KVQ8_9ENTE|nr:DUF916 and DUF3324 domain-containing protein [Enterococcus rivorum]MBP2100407.1 hypothetical protein [Enterococcus rivorum]OEH81709.1 hypothetical protein BCR26_15735 [Enterococcus rivorum]